MASLTSSDTALLASYPVNASRNQLWAAMGLWYVRPHVVNRKLFMAKELFCAMVDSHPDLVLLASRSSTSEFVGRTTEEIRDHLKHCGVEVKELSDLDLSFEGGNKFITARLLLPRKKEKTAPIVELSFINPCNEEMLFAVVPPADNQCQRFYVAFPYSLRARDGSLELTTSKEEQTSVSAEWLMTQVLPRIAKWAEAAPVGKQPALAAGSLSLVPEQRYHEVYHHLKEKYGKELVQNWTEVTDPHRYVFEDIAIAAYLLVIWELERQVKGNPELRQTFVDLGCGNGLLVFLLSSEGYTGVGIDVRKRRIWDTYPSCTKLEVRPITPSENCTFPSTDWIIGNHSDELTPWVPVIAARSSPQCRFFLLPCCFFDFNGKRYRRENSSSSRYSEYLKFVSRIVSVCGYIPQMDRLRISSTKRKCILGFDRECSPSMLKELDIAIQQFIDERCGRIGSSGGEDQKAWADFTPRVAVEPVRNCTQIAKSLVQEIVSLVCDILLAKRNVITVRSDNDEARIWNAGGCVTLKDVASLLPSEKLAALKNECGGLQTLLKNQHFLFVVEKGTVKFRVPLPKSELKNINWAKWKVKACWFHKNHPDGCPLLAADCPSEH